MNTSTPDTENTPARILIVDDSKAVRHVLYENLTAAGFEVVQAEDGQEGLNIAKQGDFDLVVTDIDMPNMDGLEMASHLKKNYETSRIPIIVLAAKDSDDLVEEGFRIGVDAYLAKGDDITENVIAIKDIMQARRLLTGSRILVVDDSQSVRAFLMTGLMGEGFQVQAASNGLEAMDKLKEWTPDLIICDLMMPTMDGASLLKELKRVEEYASIPFIMMSNVSDKPVMRRLMREGASSFLIKPFTMNQLTILIEEIFSTNYRFLLEEKQYLANEQCLTMDAVIAMVNALEARQSHSRGQSERVGVVAAAIGEELGWAPAQVDRLRLAGRLHDIGMIAVRDEILLKKEPLTNDEFEMIRTHIRVGAEILSPIPSLQDILPAAVSHHERHDGTGYPNKLAGDEIPMIARIMAVADVYEALSSERPYRDSLPPFVAMEIIKEERGTKFCPECVDAFVKWFEKTDGKIEVNTTFTSDC